MKRPIFLIIATVLVLILAGVWVYVLLYGNPDNLSERFTDFNLGDTTDTEIVVNQNPEPEPIVDVVNDESLRQLTTSPVIGFQHVQPTPSSTPMVYYVEAGTGHIYSINTFTGNETRISRTTIPNASAAEITPDGKSIMITAGQGNNKETLFGRISTTSDTILTTNIGEVAADIQPTSENTFLYLTLHSNTSAVKEYNPIANTIETLFTIPFREAVVSWGNTASEVHYIYPKASRYLEGSLYKFENGVFSRTPISGFGLSAIGDERYILYSKSTENNYRTMIFDVVNNISTESILSIIPEQCDTLKQNIGTLICSSSFEDADHELPDSWYAGNKNVGKQFFLFDIKTGGFQGHINFNDTGREIDVSDIEVNTNDSSILIKNKIDNTLWLYELNY